MSLMKYSPISSLFDPGNSFNSLVEQMFGKEQGFLNPATDIKETADAYTITAEMPGVEKKDVKVDLHDGILTISAEKTEESKKEEEGKVVWRERRQGQYMRRFDLGSNVVSDNVTAKFDNGVLNVTVPKIEKEPPAKKSIPVS